jgi:hypothetical protein
MAHWCRRGTTSLVVAAAFVLGAAGAVCSVFAILRALVSLLLCSLALGVQLRAVSRCVDELPLLLRDQRGRAPFLRPGSAVGVAQPADAVTSSAFKRCWRSASLCAYCNGARVMHAWRGGRRGTS